jgi:hypothetical protein
MVLTSFSQKSAARRNRSFKMLIVIPVGARATLFYVSMLVVLVASCVVLAQVADSVHAEELKPRQLPALYPHAQDAAERVVPFADDSEHFERVVTFITSDSPQSVLDYYVRTMQSFGWRRWSLTGAKYAGDAWFGYSPDDGPTYRVNVKTKPLTTGGTSVTLEIWTVWGTWYGDPMLQSTHP